MLLASKFFLIRDDMQMSSLDLSGCKKRRRGDKVFRFKSFGEHGYPVEFDGSFLENVKGLLECGQFEGSSCDGFPAWSFQLEVSRHPLVYKLLWVVEESIEVSSPDRHCKHCIYVGWGENLICNKKYHFLLPTKEANAKDVPLNSVGAPVDSGKSQHCHSMSMSMALHGVFHSNGFGHLLCINGVESGSELPGFQVMDFWDRLCTGLRARKLSLHDISWKRGMDLRLLYGVAYGEPWFGRWGYKFGRGSFGITPPMYKKAIEALQGIPLLLLTQSSIEVVAVSPSSHYEIPMILSRYQSLSNHSLVTLGDLFHFMLQLESRIPKENFIDPSNLAGLSESSCRWSPKRVEMATHVIVEALKRAKYRWISRQEVRDAARAYIGDTGLLDFVLKSLGNHIVGNFLVRRCLNPVTKVLEYSLEDMSKLFPFQELNAYARSNITKAQLMKDITCLYKTIFKQTDSIHNPDMNNKVLLAMRIILDSKYFIKECNDARASSLEVGIMGGSKLRVFCTISLRDHRQIINTPPYESFTLQERATVDELKLKVESAFRELYLGMRSFVAESILNNLDGAKGYEPVFGLVEVGGRVVVEGRLGTKTDEEIHELGGAAGRRLVDCCCGAKVDDGERMVSCDICEVWQHTRCVDIPNDQQVPSIYLCKRCEGHIVLSPNLLP